MEKLSDFSQLIITPDQDMDSNDLSSLCEVYNILNKARLDFLNMKLSLDEYLELLFDSGVNVDSYLEGINTNLSNFLGYDITTQLY